MCVCVFMCAYGGGGGVCVRGVPVLSLRTFKWIIKKIYYLNRCVSLGERYEGIDSYRI